MPESKPRIDPMTGAMTFPPGRWRRSSQIGEWVRAKDSETAEVIVSDSKVMPESDFDEFIRDVTQVNPMPKSKVRERLNALLEASLASVIGEDDELRDRSDMIEGTYHRNKGRNELRAEQRRRAGL